MKISPTGSQRDYTKGLVKTLKAVFRDPKSDGSIRQKAIGMLAETMICDMFGKERNRARGFDNGVDLTLNGIKIDIKTMERKGDFKPHYINNLFASQVDNESYLNDIYLFTSYNSVKEELDVIGWIRKHDVKLLNNGVKYCKEGQVRVRYDGSSFILKSGNYEIPYRSLEPFISPETFLMEIGKLKPL